MESEQLYFHVNSNAGSLSDLNGGWNAWFKGQHVDRLNTRTYDLFSFSIIFYGLDAKSSLNVDRKSWKNDFIRNIQNNNFFENLSYSVLEAHSEELKEMLGDDMKLSLFSYLYDPKNKLEKIDKTSWENMKLFSKKLAYRNYNENCSLYDKTFNELLQTENFSIVNVKTDNKLDESFSETEIIVDSNPYSFWVMNEFNERWYRNGSIAKVEEESIFIKKNLL